MARLTISRGLSGSGKSTWARAQKDAVVVSRDDLRVALFGSDGPEYYAHPDLSDREAFITKVQHDAIKRALLAGHHVISDDTNIEMRFVNVLAKIAYSVGAEVRVKSFEVPVEVAIERNAFRALAGGRSVPNEVIVQQHKRFDPNAKLPKRPVIKPYTGTPGKPKAFMVDIDGTLADMAGKRGPYDLNVGGDEPRKAVIEAVNGLAFSRQSDVGRYEFDVIVMSGRKEDCRDDTEKWLVKNDVVFDRLFMRASDDNRSDNLIKHDLFWEHVAPYYDVQFVFDDRNQVVDMWRSMGLDCFQVAQGEF